MQSESESMEAKKKRPLRRRRGILGSEASKIQGKSKTEMCPSVLANRRLVVIWEREIGGEAREQEFRVMMRQLRGSEHRPLWEEGGQ